MSTESRVSRHDVIAFLLLMGYGTLVMILWPLERWARRRRE